MRDLVRRIVNSYKSLRLESQDRGYVLFSGQEPDSRELVSIKILPRLPSSKTNFLKIKPRSFKATLRILKSFFKTQIPQHSTQRPRQSAS